MRFLEVLESYARRQRAKHSDAQKAREKVVSANKKRSAAARRYQDQLQACNSAISQARASLDEGFLGRYALRDQRGSLLGWIEPQGRLIVAKDASGSLVGWYDPRLNTTRNRHGVPVGTGDLLSALVICGQ